MALTWATRRRVMIYGGAALVALTLLAGVVIAVVYEAPSCSDGKQNQGEAGVDCGGSCAYLCESQVQELRTPLVRALPTATGRTDVVAYIENRNQNAEAKDVRYTIEVYADGGVRIGSQTGTVDVPARATVPVFVPGVVSGISTAPQAFITFENLRWRNARGEAEPLSVGSTELLSGDAPRVRAVIENPGPQATYNRTVVATVFDASGRAIAASQTVLRSVPAGGNAEAIFTWTAPFPEAAARVEVRAVPELP